MKFIIEAARFLSQDNTLMTAAFLYPFTWNYPFKTYLQRPIFTVWDSAITGLLFAMCSQYVSTWLPDQFRGILTTVLILSSVYYSYKNLTGTLPTDPSA